MMGGEGMGKDNGGGKRGTGEGKRRTEGGIRGIG